MSHAIVQRSAAMAPAQSVMEEGQYFASLASGIIKEMLDLAGNCKRYASNLHTEQVRIEALDGPRHTFTNETHKEFHQEYGVQGMYKELAKALNVSKSLSEHETPVSYTYPYRDLPKPPLDWDQSFWWPSNLKYESYSSNAHRLNDLEAELMRLIKLQNETLEEVKEIIKTIQKRIEKDLEVFKTSGDQLVAFENKTNQNIASARRVRVQLEREIHATQARFQRVMAKAARL